MTHRPEANLPPDLHYDDNEARKYTQNSRIMSIQSEMSERAIELLSLDPAGSRGAQLVLDIGCGSGISGDALTSAGLAWIGLDISQSMLDVALDDEDLETGGLTLGDMGQGLPFRAGCFDAAISISALQWLAYSDRSSCNPIRRQRAFFTSLYSTLAVGARAVLQFYPADELQLQLLLNSAMSSGFTGGLVTDYPDSSKSRKHYLVLDTAGFKSLPRGLDDEGSASQRLQLQQKMRKGSKAWILRKKDQFRRRHGEMDESRRLPADSKYTGRKRKARF